MRTFAWTAGLLAASFTLAWCQGPGLPAAHYSCRIDPHHTDFIDIGSDHSMRWITSQTGRDAHSHVAAGSWELRATKNGNWMGRFVVQTVMSTGPGSSEKHEGEQVLNMTLHTGDTVDFMLVAQGASTGRFQFTAFDKEQHPLYSQEYTRESL